MSYSVLDLLVADHRRLRSLYREIHAVLQQSTTLSEEACFNIFKTFKSLTIAHIKAEEFALYALFDVDKKMRDVELQGSVLEGFEEHDLIENLLKEMGQAEEVTPQWKAQFKVVCELIEHHFREEEQDFFPRVLSSLSVEELKQLVPAYQKERDQIFTKKSGLDIGAAGLFNPEGSDEIAIPSMLPR